MRSPAIYARGCVLVENVYAESIETAGAHYFKSGMPLRVFFAATPCPCCREGSRAGDADQWRNGRAFRQPFGPRLDGQLLWFERSGLCAAIRLQIGRASC